MGRKNIVRWNLTPMGVVGSESIILGYERIIKPHQSLSINFGQLKFKQLLNLNLEKYGVNTERKSQGYSLAMDYRRYFKKRNRGFAPDGLYWGPFFTYYHYQLEIGVNYVVPETQVKLEANVGTIINVYHFGLELGYQFIIAKRLSIDMVLAGPSFGRYNAKFYASSNVDTDEIDDIYKELFDNIKERYPGVGALVDNKSVESDGTFNRDTFGMRYVLQIGFLF